MLNQNIKTLVNCDKFFKYQMLTNKKYKFPKLILGTFQHNDKTLLNEIIRTCLENGIYAFDSAPSYQTEELLVDVLKSNMIDLNISRNDIYFCSKIDAMQMYEMKGRIQEYLIHFLQKHDLEYLDQLLIHWPIPELFTETWHSFIELYNSGYVKAIGVSNVQIRHLNMLKNFELEPMVIQNERHPLRDDYVVMNYCKKKEISYQSYSPLGRMIDEIKNSKIIYDLSMKYNRTPGQIIIRWQIDSGCIPVFMTTKKQRVINYSKVFDFSLEKEDILQISFLNKNHKIFLESISCPGY